MQLPRFEPHSNHGTIHPPVAGASLVQREHYYDSQGEYLYSVGADGSRYKVGASAPAKAKAKPTATQANTETKGDNLDLDGWVKGEKTIPWPTVQKEVRTRFPEVDTSSKLAMIDGLKAAGVGI